MIKVLLIFWLIASVLGFVAIGWGGFFLSFFLLMILFPFIALLSDKPGQTPRHINNSHHDAGFNDQPDTNYPPFYPPYGGIGNKDDYPIIMPPNFDPSNPWDVAFLAQQRARRNRKRNED